MQVSSQVHVLFCCCCFLVFLIWRDFFKESVHIRWGFPGGTSGKEPTCQWGDLRDEGSIPGWGRSPRGGHNNLLQHSCLENPMDRGASWATLYRVRLQRVRHNWSDLACMYCIYPRSLSYAYLDPKTSRGGFSELFDHRTSSPFLLLFFFIMQFKWCLVGDWCYTEQSLGNFLWKWKWMVKMLVTQLCPTLCHPMDCSLPGSSLHGILQARILECLSMPSSRGSSPPGDQTLVSFVSCVGRWVLYH